MQAIPIRVPAIATRANVPIEICVTRLHQQRDVAQPGWPQGTAPEQMQAHAWLIFVAQDAQRLIAETDDPRAREQAVPSAAAPSQSLA